MKENKSKNWIALSGIGVAFVVLLGILQLLMPNIIKVENAVAGNFGVFVCLVGILVFILCAVAFFNVHSKMRLVILGFMPLVLAVAFLGYVAKWWFVG